MKNENDEILENNFGEPWYTEYLPDFPLKEGETYLVPLKLLKKERRFDGGRGTEYYLFGDCERLGRYVSFSDYMLPKIEKTKMDDESLEKEFRKIMNPVELTDELKEKIYQKFNI